MIIVYVIMVINLEKGKYNQVSLNFELYNLLFCPLPTYVCLLHDRKCNK